MTILIRASGRKWQPDEVDGLEIDNRSPGTIHFGRDLLRRLVQPGLFGPARRLRQHAAASDLVGLMARLLPKTAAALRTAFRDDTFLDTVWDSALPAKDLTRAEEPAVASALPALEATGEEVFSVLPISTDP